MSKEKVGSEPINDGAANGADGRRASKKKRKAKADYQIDIRAALEDPVRVTQDGKSQKVSAFEVTIRQHLKKSLFEKSIASMKFIIEQAEKYQIIKPPPAPPSGGIFVIPKGLPEVRRARDLRASAGAWRARTHVANYWHLEEVLR